MINIANWNLQLQGLNVMFHEWTHFAKLLLAKRFKQKQRLRHIIIH